MFNEAYDIFLLGQSEDGKGRPTRMMFIEASVKSLREDF